MKTFVEDSTLDRNRLIFLEETLTEIEQLCNEVQQERLRYQKCQQERLHEKNKYMQLRNHVESVVHRLSCHKTGEIQAATETAIDQTKDFLQRRNGKENTDGNKRPTLTLRQGKHNPSQSKRK